MHSLRWITVALALSMLPACDGPEGPACRMDANMVAPRVVAGIERADARSFVRIAWDAPETGESAGLGADYFEQVRAVEPASSIATSASLTAEREITLRLETSRIVPGEHEVSLLFPDHRGVTGCWHPGMDDRYLLDLTLVIDATGALTSSMLRERVQLGAI
jgi:hypothetical protein